MNPISAVIFIIFIGGAVLARLANMPITVTIVLALIGVFLGYSVKMAQQWERAVILRLGKLHAVKGPGLFILVPIFDQIAVWIDQRIRTSEFSAEQALVCGRKVEFRLGLKIDIKMVNYLDLVSTFTFTSGHSV